MDHDHSCRHLVALTSGQGRILKALLEKCQVPESSLKVVGVIASKPNIGALDLAQEYNIKNSVINRTSYVNYTEWDQAICRQLEQWGADWVLLSGFLQRIGPHVLRRFSNRIINSHPALLPAYGGKGMYGHHVHEAVIAAKEKESGVTVHLVNENYDEGPIMAQERLILLPQETPASLEARIIELEKRVVVETVMKYCAPKLKIT